MNDSDFEAIRTKWQEETPLYERLCQKVDAILTTKTKYIYPKPTVSSRTKETNSLLKKIKSKNYADPYENVKDKAGARIVCTYVDTLDRIKTIINNHFIVLREERKADEFGIAGIGYQGIHFDVTLHPSTNKGLKELNDLKCEIQLITRAQALWADISHELNYKSATSPPDEVIRTLNLQGALLENFDTQMSAIRRQVYSIPGMSIVNMLQELEKHLREFTSREYNEELSRYIVEGLEQLNSNLHEGHVAALDDFVRANMDRLEVIYETYADDERDFLVFQPETLLVFMWMERDIFELTFAWDRIMPHNRLRELCDVWGVLDIYDT